MEADKEIQTPLERVRELMVQHHEKMDSANVLSPETKSRSEGFLEALYHIESVLIHFNETLKQ